MTFALVAIAAWFWRRPLAGVFLGLMVLLALAMLIVPAWTAYVLAVIIGLAFLHHVQRRSRRGRSR